MKHTSSLLLAAAASLAAAQSPVIVKILVPNVDDQAIVASVISAGPTATSYFIACPTDTSDEDCGLGTGFEVLYGPSTMAYDMTFSDTYTASAACKLEPAKNAADCTGAFIESNTEGKTTSTISESMTGYSSYIFPVTITAGAEKLSGVAGSSSDGGASTTLSNPAATETDAGSSSATGTTLSTSAVPTNSGSGSGSTAPTSSSSTGGMPRITQNAVVMGAAALVGGAMLL